MTGDPFRWTTLAHRDREFLGPVGEVVCDEMLAAVEPGLRAGTLAPRTLDVGCGKAAWLLRAVTRLGGEGVGVDPNRAFLAEARARAEALGVASRVRLVEGVFEPRRPAEAPFDLGLCIGSLHAFGGFEDALRGLAAQVRPDGAAIVGAGYWRRDPDPEYLATFGGNAAETTSLDRLLEAPRALGWRVLAHHASTTSEWDDYEHGYAARVREWCAAHPGDADAEAFARRIDAWAGAYERWGRDTMGFVSLALARA